MEMFLGKWQRVPSSPVFTNDTELELTEVKGTKLSIRCQPESLLKTDGQKTLNKLQEHYHTSVLYCIQYFDVPRSDLH